ncbi:hypothetical protein [Planococcus lenghuensis]|uniref:Uncharacterized protein n=1 Tax=Planococcus lenghuensis TaxID=2213202 RepID=A0A1Q2L592_9BACL|nr:hypothetical protein [Planococcus lenghuensis]AQQ55571.1 hypothetical protein B0X71_20575 [Planococcus lenghuensis]
MKTATENLLNNFPTLKPYVEKEEIHPEELAVSPHEQTVIELARFFEYEEPFQLEKLFSNLDPSWIPLALEELQTYFYEDTYLAKTPKPLIIKDPADLLSQKGFADFLSENGLSIDVKKLHMYWKRGKLPEETVTIGGKPYWLRETAQQYITDKQGAPD